MDEKGFGALLKNFENKDLDFKAEMPKSQKVAELVTAFYNSNGGTIIFGVDDAREPVGLADPQKIENRFTQIMRHWCSLDAEPEIEFVRYDGMNFMVVSCPKGKDTPYFVRGENVPRVRAGSSNMPANKEEIARLYREGSSDSQDTYLVKNAALDDLDLEKIKDYFMESELTGQLNEKHFQGLLRKEHLVVDENGKLIPTIAGILLFGKHPSVNMSNVVLKADRYKGNTVVEWIDKQDLEGTIFEQIEDCVRFFKRNMKIAAWSAETHTEHRTEYPIDALKEAVINALVHRDWKERKNILVRMFDDKIEIISPGELLRPLTIKKLRDHSYRPLSRNKIITKILAKRKIMDERGTGILRMEQFMGEWGLERPEYSEEDGYFITTFKGPGLPEITIPTYKLEDLNERQKKAIKLIKSNGKITRNEYIDITKTTRSTAVRDLNDMVDKDVLVIKGPKTGRGRYYILKVS